MRILTALLLIASMVLAIPVEAQMTLPQTRMVEAQRSVDSLNRSMQAAEAAAKKQQEEPAAHHVSYTWLVLVVIALWLFSRRRRLQDSQPSAKSGV
jgi:hypothetical protein